MGARLGDRPGHKGGKLSTQHCKMGLKTTGVNSPKCWDLSPLSLEGLPREAGAESRKLPQAPKPAHVPCGAAEGISVPKKVP